MQLNLLKKSFDLDGAALILVGDYESCPPAQIFENSQQLKDFKSNKIVDQENQILLYVESSTDCLARLCDFESPNRGRFSGRRRRADDPNEPRRIDRH